MSLESTLVELIKVRCARVFPDEAPFGTETPYVIYQQVGGDALAYVEGTMPDKRNAHMQIAVWDATRAGAISLALQLEADLVATMKAEPLGAFVSAASDFPDRRGTHQDFSIWWDR
ncbi:MAG: DUF3168 domain-containing protein [Aquabacterium sp.]|uniref:tail completion protein gp17 n=1 Tax=Aquabacterium sp. TaxID=1872578 RepID=UPI0011FDB105|nr:DUF3168 domain-containing protein [Aquabacterium sp.]TAK84513.1 MAG: DUF3168 domain-containing protein [Aquabacterium sp.]